MTPFDAQIRAARAAQINQCILYFMDSHPSRHPRILKLLEGELDKFIADGNRFVKMIGDIPVYETAQPRGSLTEMAFYSPA